MTNKNNHEVDLMEYWRILKKRKILIFFLTFAGGILGVLYSFSLPRVYSASVSTLSLSESSSAGSNNPLGALFSGSFGSSNQNTKKFMAILQTRSLAKDVIEQHDLLPILFKDQWDNNQKKWINPSQVPSVSQGVNKLAGLASGVEDATTPVFYIQVEYEDPYTAALIANAYAESLQTYLNKNDLTVERKKRIFMEEQLKISQRNLMLLDREIAAFHSKNKTASVNINLEKNSAFSSLIPFIVNSDINDPLTKPQNNNQPTNEIPNSMLFDYLIKYRESLEIFHGALINQLVVAKLEEEKESLNFQVLDNAEPQLIPVRPQKKMIIILTTLSFSIMSVLLAFVIEYVKIRQKPSLKTSS